MKQLVERKFSVGSGFVKSSVNAGNQSKHGNNQLINNLMSLHHVSL